MSLKQASGFVSVIFLIAMVAGFVAFSGHVNGQSEQESAGQGGPLKIPSPVNIEYKQEPLIIRKENGEELTFNVELALTPRQQARGLMFRTEMAEDAGMLFVFNTTAPIAFWMKNTLIPLDMLFLDEGGTILHIHKNAVPQDTTSIPSRYPAKAVLELNGGSADKLGIREGDTIRHRFF